jgi:hypothetical protein
LHKEVNVKNRVFGFSGLFIILLLLCCSAAQAAYTPLYLPESSLWQGSRVYDEDGIYAYVEYAVYDSSDTLNGYHNTLDGLTDGFPNPGDGTYIYAYEIRNLGSQTSQLPVMAFRIIGGDPANASGMGHVDDGGIAPTDSPKSTDSAFLWKFDNGFLEVGTHSAFLVFSSDSGPVAGAFTFANLGDNGPPPPVNDSSTPEPASLALLAAGAVTMLTRRNRKK